MSLDVASLVSCAAPVKSVAPSPLAVVICADSVSAIPSANKAGRPRRKTARPQEPAASGRNFPVSGARRFGGRLPRRYRERVAIDE